MQFLILGFDGVDTDAPKRRQDAREAHLAALAKLKERGEALIGAALLSPEGEMTGSALIVDFPTIDDLQAWLKAEPYMTASVWQALKIFPCKLAGIFT